MIANGVVVSGMGGGDSTTRGFIEGYDPGHRQEAVAHVDHTRAGRARFRNVAARDQARGLEIWRRRDLAIMLRMTRNSTCSISAPATPSRITHPIAMAWTVCTPPSTLAIRPKTGEMVWYYQSMPNDSFDFDANAESVLADIQVDGQMRKVLINAHKNGFLYVLDRTNGKLIAANPFVKVNWATHIDLKTGRPVLTDILERAIKGETVNVFPSRGTNATLIAFNPKTGLVYLNSWNLPRLMKYRGFQVCARRGIDRHRIDHDHAGRRAGRIITWPSTR